MARIMITGASGGIGRALCEHLLSEGHSVMGTYWRHLENARFCTTYKDRFACVPMDLGEPASMDRAVEEGVRCFGGIDAVVALAGSAGNPEFLIRAKPQRVMDVVFQNLVGTILTARAAVPQLIKNRSSAIVLISSVSAVAPSAGMTAYAAAKSGIEGFTLALAREYAGRGLAVTCVRLGPIRTQMLAELGDAAIDRLSAALPTKQIPLPDDAASVIKDVLVGTLAGRLNGSVVNADAGYTVWRAM